jgi:hypothetical protein
MRNRKGGVLAEVNVEGNVGRVREKGNRQGRRSVSNSEKYYSKVWLL